MHHLTTLFVQHIQKHIYSISIVNQRTQICRMHFTLSAMGVDKGVKVDIENYKLSDNKLLRTPFIFDITYFARTTKDDDERRHHTHTISYINRNAFLISGLNGAVYYYRVSDNNSYSVASKVIAVFSARIQTFLLNFERWMAGTVISRGCSGASDCGCTTISGRASLSGVELMALLWRCG